MRTVIDLVLLAIIIISIWSGYKKGFIMGIAGLVAIIVSLYGASLVSSAFSYEVVPALRPFASGYVESQMQENVLEDMGIGESGLDRLVTLGYKLLGLISYLTAGPKEVRAWTIENGTKAPQAAGKIHSDFERGFIRAETINFDEMMACGGSVAAAKEKGLLRSEGKEYVVKDGDMIYFRFNV